MVFLPCRQEKPLQNSSTERNSYACLTISNFGGLMSGMLVIDRQRKLFWSPSNATFDFTVERMGELMKEERPDIAKEFFDSASGIPGLSHLDIEDFSLVDKEYVLTILTVFRHQLAEEGRANPPVMKYDMIGEYPDFIKDIIRPLLPLSMEHVKTDECSDAVKNILNSFAPYSMNYEGMDKSLAQFEDTLRGAIGGGEKLSEVVFSP